MNKLVITQDNSRTEYPVPNAVITALYNIGKDDDQNLSLTEGVDTTNNNRPVSTVSGSIRVATAYAHHLLYIAVKYPNLSITADSTYIYFADPEVERVLLANGIGDGVGVSVQDASQATISSNVFLGNSTITSFNEFGYFTRANSNPQNALFKNCTALSQIDLSNVSIISNEEFKYTAINILDAPNLQFFSGEHLFDTCSELTSVTNLGSVINIPRYCFYNCKKLETVVLPLSCTTIVRNAFLDCKSLTNINLDNVTTILDVAFQSCKALDIYTSKLLNCTSIGNYSFLNTHRITEDIFLPNLLIAGNGIFRETRGSYKATCLGKISKIPDDMFQNPLDNTGPTLVYLPYECTEIGVNAFRNDKSLTTIKQYTQSVDDWVDGQPSSYGECVNITIFGNNCFHGCSLLSLTPQDIQNATTIGVEAFNGVSLLSGTLNLPNLTGTLGRYSFNNTGISSISSLGTVTEIGECAFGNTNVSSITIPKSVKKCASSIVSDTVVPEIIFPEGVEEIYGGLFLTKNNSLTYIEIPSTVTNMGIFFHMSLEKSLNDLCTVVIKATTPPTLTYYNNNASSTKGNKFSGIYVPDASLTAYQSAADAWQHSSIQAKLKPISQLQTDNPTAWAKYNRV